MKILHFLTGGLLRSDELNEQVTDSGIIDAWQAQADVEEWMIYLNEENSIELTFKRLIVN